MCMGGCVSECMFCHNSSDIHGGEKRASCSLGLKLQVVVSMELDAGI